MLHMYDAHDSTLGKDIFRGLVFYALHKLFSSIDWVTFLIFSSSPILAISAMDYFKLLILPGPRSICPRSSHHSFLWEIPYT